jgi:hypothetical protein
VDLLKGQRNGAEPYKDPGRAADLVIFPHKFGWKTLREADGAVAGHALSRGPRSRFYINLCGNATRLCRAFMTRYRPGAR